MVLESRWEGHVVTELLLLFQIYLFFSTFIYLFFLGGKGGGTHNNNY